MRSTIFNLIALLPLLGGSAFNLLSASALQVPHIHAPSPQDALGVAESFLNPGGVGQEAAREHPSTTLGYASDVKLQSVGEEFMVLTHDMFPDHRVKIKSTTGWCDPDVRSFSGYLDVGYGKDLFFYFFESRSKPSEDPVIMWINGGPGCSSSLGMLMELGPCSVKDGPKTANDTDYNPYAWNDKANIFFLDEPIGVGFSHAEHGQKVATTEAAAKDVQAFVTIFFEAFKEYEGRAFHMAGESYGGRYLPVFASAVVDGNKALVKAGKTPINLQSVMIGNGVTDHFTTIESYFPFQCTLNGDLTEPVQSIGNCVSMAENVPKCAKLSRKHCIESHDYTQCWMAVNYCEEVLESAFWSAGVNPYDVSMPCSPEELGDSLCYPVTKKIKTYLDLPEVRDLLGVHEHRGNWSSCDNGVGARFSQSMDSTGQTWLYVAGLLERGIRVLNYVGQQDFICNHIANERWMEALEWTGKESYNAAQFADWSVNGDVAGTYKTSGNLTMLKIRGAGHMVPYDKPKEALTMVNSWLNAVAYGDKA
ncbi:cathepsin A (carboxypeptidase C) [Kwoniella heveanensis CBS 569]|nr:cathepsin A (carboxypeptidase C) [Kwoniella heveanensis CBS 569]